MSSANTGQTRYRWRNDDGDEVDATWKAAIDTGWTPVLADMDTPHRLRVECQNNGGKVESTEPYNLYFDIDGGGYNPLTTSSTGLKAVNSADVDFVDGDATTEQMAGPNTFVAGEQSENGETGLMTPTFARDWEHEYCFEAVSADLSGDEVITFEVRWSTGDSMDFYTIRPTMTIPTIPSGEWTQAEFRIRASGRLGDEQAINDNGAGDWEAAANTSATLQPGPNKAGTVFGLRFKVSAAVASSTKTLKIQAAKNGGGYSDLVKDFHNDQSLLVSGVPVGLIPTINYTDGAATTQLLTGSNFIAGTGEHDGTAAAVTLDVGEHTEIEWRVYINKTWEACGVGNVDGDYYDFRLVEDDDTVLTTYSNTPRITLDYDNDYVGGCYPESIGDYGIYFASDGDAFTIVEESELTGDVLLMRRATGTTKWEVADSGGEPNALSDLEAFHIQQDGNTLHLFAQASGNTLYCPVDISAHTWGTAETVHTATGAVNQAVWGAFRSDGTALCFYMDGVDSCIWKKRSVGGVWDTTGTTFQSPTVTGFSGVLAADDKVYIVYNDDELTVYSKSLSKTEAYGTEQTITTDPWITGGGVQWALIAPVYWDDSGTEKVGVIYQGSDGLLYWKIISNDGTPGSESAVTDAAVTDNRAGLNSRQPAANAVVDSDQIYVVFSLNSSEDVYYTLSDNGGTFGTDVEIQDGVKVHGVGVTFDSSILHILTEEPNVDDTAPEGRSGFTGGISVIEYALSGGDDDLTADNIKTDAEVGTPAIGQEHDLTSSAIQTDVEVDTPVVGQTHALTATGITTDPVVGTPTVEEIHVLDANDITTDPVVETPAIGQTHVLDANDISTTPELDTPSIGQTHSLDSSDITVDPVVGTPTAAQSHLLDANGISTTPVVDNPTVGQTHVLDANDISSDPVVGTPTIGQSHVLDATDITADPVVETPTVAEGHVLAATGITTDPVVDNPTLTHIHNLTATAITTDPVLGTPVLAEEGEDALDANGITTNPVVATPAIGQEHVLSATGITTDPVVDNPTLTHIHDLSASSIQTDVEVDTPTVTHIHDLSATGITTDPVVGTPVLTEEGEDALTANDIQTDVEVGTPALAQAHALAGTGITSDPVLGTPVLTEEGEDALTATGITTDSVVGTPAIGQAHALTSTVITTDPVVETPTLTEEAEDALTATGITTTPVVETPIVGQVHILTATGIVTAPEVDTAAIGQIQTLDAAGIETTPELDNPTLSHVHVLTATGITTNPVVAASSIGQAHALDATTIIVSPVVGNPSIGQTHILTASGIITVPTVGSPSWDLVEGVVVIDFSVIYPETTFTVIKPEITFSIPMED